MKKFLVAAMIIIALSLSGCATMKGLSHEEELFDNSVTVVIITGAGEYDSSTMEKWQDAFPEAVVIVPEEAWPLYFGAEDIARQIMERRRKGEIRGRVVPIGLSYGGNLSREFTALFPSLVSATVTIGSPAGGVKYMPSWPKFLSIVPDDGDCAVPLFVVAGVKAGIPKPVWMDGPSDGTVGLKQATALFERKVEEVIVFEHEHAELFKSSEVIGWVKERLKPFLESKQLNMVAARQREGE